MYRRSSMRLRNKVSYGEHVRKEHSTSTASIKLIRKGNKPIGLIGAGNKPIGLIGAGNTPITLIPAGNTPITLIPAGNTPIRLIPAGITRTSRNVERTLHTLESSEVSEVNEVVDLDQSSSVFYSLLIAKACATLILLSLLFWFVSSFLSPDGLQPSMETVFLSSRPDPDCVSAIGQRNMDRLLDMFRKLDHVNEEIKHSVSLDIQDMKAHLDEVSSNNRLRLSAVRKKLIDSRAEWNSEFASFMLQLKNFPGDIARISQDLSMKKTTPQVPRPMADRMADFALESEGGSVISSRCSETYNSSMTFFGCSLCVPERPAIVIQGYRELRLGKCWAFKGTQGTLLISLSQPVSITHVTLDHLPRNKSPTGRINSAPKQFQVFGMNNENEAGTLLGKFTYDQNGEPTQTFELPHPSNVHHIVKLLVLTNWGQKDYTCLYRFRVHGKEV